MRKDRQVTTWCCDRCAEEADCYDGAVPDGWHVVGISTTTTDGEADAEVADICPACSGLLGKFMAGAQLAEEAEE